MLRQRLRDLRKHVVLRVHGSGTRVAITSRTELTDQPLDPTWIDEGQPRTRGTVQVRSDDGTIQSGEWDCSAGRFRWTYYEDEMVHILEGQAFIEVDGKMRSIETGDWVFFPLGRTVRWHVPQYVRKVFFIRHPNKVVNLLRTFKILGAFAGGLLSENVLLDPLLLALS
jgi:uncharacterized cupin superfamily protein